ncbi:MAG: acyloxyacyl hydrolase [Kiloniellales bacterium]
MRYRRFNASFGLVIALAVAAGAPGGVRADDPSFLTLGLGYFDMNKQDNEAVDFRLEYRHGQKFWIFKPWIGVEATSDGAVYGAAGVLIDVFLGNRFVLTPSFGAGYYEEGDGKDLGHEIEFRSQIEVSYRFDDRSRLGLAFSHISNASIGADNPGVEILNVYYSVPLEGLLE